MQASRNLDPHFAYCIFCIFFWGIHWYLFELFPLLLSLLRIAMGVPVCCSLSVCCREVFPKRTTKIEFSLENFELIKNSNIWSLGNGKILGKLLAIEQKKNIVVNMSRVPIEKNRMLKKQLKYRNHKNDSNDLFGCLGN